MTPADDHVLVTGATGFIGRHLCERLITRGRTVHALAREPGRTSHLPQDRRLQIHMIHEASEVSEIIASEPISGIVHLATHFVARHSSPADLVAMMRANIELGALVAEAAAQRHIPLVSASSIWQHFESQAYFPVSLYAATKQAQDDILTYYGRVEGLPWTRVILGDTYGPGDDRGKLLTQILEAAYGHVPMLASSGRQLWDPVHADDVASALELCLDELQHDPDQRQYQVRSVAPRSIRETVALIEEVTGRAVPIEWNARPDRGREMLEPWIVAALPPGWRPTVDLRDGLAEAWAAYTESQKRPGPDV